MIFDEPLLDDLDDELETSKCTTTKNDKGTYVTICNCKHPSR